MAKFVRLGLWLAALLGCSGLVLTTGCATAPIPSHIHSDANADAAQKASDALTSEAKTASGLYSTMSANVGKFTSSENQLLSDLSANATSTLITADAVVMTGGTLATRRNKTDNCAVRLLAVSSTAPEIPNPNEAWPYCSDQVLNNLQKDISDLSSSTTDQSLAAAIATQQAEVDSIKKNVNTWNADVAVMQLVLQHLPTNSTSQPKGSSSLTTLESGASTLSGLAVDYVDADGKKVNTTVGAVVLTQAKSALATNDVINIENALPRAPGTELIVAQLGLTMLRLKQQQAQADLSDARNVKDLLTQADAELQTARALIALSFIDPFQEGSTIITQLTGEARGGDLKLVAGELTYVRQEAIAESIVQRVAVTLPVSIARMRHMRSIRDSSYDDQQYQAIMQSEVAGLLVYHQGGLTSQEIANVISFAQAVGVGVLAGRVH